MNILLAWILQPSSVAGISALFGTVFAVLTHQMSWAQALPVLAGGAVAVVLPDNSVVKADAQSLAADVVKQIIPAKATP